MTEPSDHASDIEPQGPWDPQDIWQAQQKDSPDMIALADLHARARKFEGRIQFRNAFEYAACGVTLLGFTQPLIFGPNWMMRVGAAVTMLATVYVGWQLHRRASVDATPAIGESLIDSYRRQLTRQRDAIASIWSWYLAPFVPGLSLLLAGMWFRAPKPGVPIERAHISLLIVVAIEVAVFFGIWLLNRLGARRLQKRIDDL